MNRRYFFSRFVSILLVFTMMASTGVLAEGASTPEAAPMDVESVSKEAETPAPVEEPSSAPKEEPTEAPSEEPTEKPTEAPTEEPTEEPTEAPTEAPTEEPTEEPSEEPTEAPTEEPTDTPTEAPTGVPTEEPTTSPSEEPVATPTATPTAAPAEAKDPRPATPTLNYVSSLSANSLRLSWTAVPGVAGYQVLTGSAAEGTMGILADVSASATSYTHKNAPSGRVVYYRVRCYIMSGKTRVYSYCSDAVGGFGLNAPKNLNGTYTSKTAVRLTWSAVTNASAYSVYRATIGSSSFSYIGKTYTPGYTDTTCVVGQGYVYRVFASRTEDFTKFMGPRSANATAGLLTPALNTATQSAAASVTLNWSTVAGADYYYVYRSAHSNYGYDYIGSSAAATTAKMNWTDTAPIPGSNNYYRIRAVRKVGSSRIYSAYSAIRDCYPIATPTITKAEIVSERSGKITWTVIPNVTGYYVYRIAQGEATYKKVGTTATNSFTDTSCVTGINYYYRVLGYRTRNGVTQRGTWSDFYCFVLLGSPMVSTTSDAGGITLNWGTVDGASFYRVYTATTSRGPWTYLGSTGLTTYYATITDERPYYYRVSAVHDFGINKVVGLYSNIVGNYVVPVPSFTGCEMSSTNSIYLTWDTIPRVIGYTLYRATSQNGTYSYVKDIPTPEISTTDTELAAGTYFYKLRAYKVYNNIRYYSDYSDFVTTTILGTPSFTGSFSYVGQTTLKFGWTSVVGAEGYTLYRSKTSGGSFTAVKTFAGNASMAGTDTNLTAKTTYYYKIAAYKMINGIKMEGVASAEYAATTSGRASISGLQSAHPYTNNLNKTYTYSVTGAYRLEVQFSTYCQLERGGDYLHVYRLDSTGSQVLVGSYTGSQLQGTTLNILGNTVIFQLVTDSNTTAWGFKVDSIIPYVSETSRSIAK